MYNCHHKFILIVLPFVIDTFRDMNLLMLKVLIQVHTSRFTPLGEFTPRVSQVKGVKSHWWCLVHFYTN